MKAILSVWPLLVLLSLSSCRSCPPEEKSCTCKVCASFGPTPGFNSTISVTPTSPNQPAMWVAWNLNGNQTNSGSSTFHSVWIGSEDENVLIGGVTATQGTSYELKITNLGEPTANVTLINTSTGQVLDPSENSIDLSTEAFSVSVHQHPSNPDAFLLIVTGPNGGVKVTLASAP